MNPVASGAAATVSDAQSWPSRGNMTADVLRTALGTEPVDAPTIRALEILCRKVDVWKRVWVAYDDSWKKAREKEPLPLSQWPALVAAVLHAASAMNAAAPAERGLRIKLVNSAFNALDLYRSLGGSTMSDELDRWARDLLRAEAHG